MSYRASSVHELFGGKLNDIQVRIDGIPRGIVYSVDYTNYLFKLRNHDLIECRGKTEIGGMSLVSLLKTASEETKYVKLEGVYKEGDYFEVHSVKFDD